MAKSRVETLGSYVTRIMNEKGMNPEDVSKIAGNQITDGYIRSIAKRRALNLSVEKAQALARGLDVSEDELFKVARGLPIEENVREADVRKDRLILGLIGESLKNETLRDLLCEIARLPRSSQRKALNAIKAFNKRKPVSLPPRKRAR